MYLHFEKRVDSPQSFLLTFYFSGQDLQTLVQRSLLQNHNEIFWMAREQWTENMSVKFIIKIHIITKSISSYE